MSSYYIETAKSYQCESCERHKPVTQTHTVALPKKFGFNHEIGIVCLEVKSTLHLREHSVPGYNISTCNFFKQGGGTPSSRACLTALQQHWCAWAGQPKRMVVDGGLRNRGVFLLQWVESVSYTHLTLPTILLV
eukprot:7498502-Pyramimonas_sp.AAC.1